ncbi:MAG: ATP-binding protein [Verrucomicrobia bacterium]|nr:ATP-binding protein [Verrucomicrobiota bacterium]
MIKPRHLEKRLKNAAEKYSAVALTGPRQSGKTTLCRALFPNHEYLNLERPDLREFADSDPNAFLKRYKGPVIFDEVQRTPDLFSYLMPLIDEDPSPGRFILTGSQNFLLMDSITQSLAGRCAILHLLPFSLREIQERPARKLAIPPLADGEATVSDAPDLAVHMFTGGFPPIHDRDYDPQDWLAQYVQTYVERDVRTLINVGDLETFERFLRLCAGRAGQILNHSGLAADCGVSVMTAKRWLSVLKTSFTVVLLRPHFANFNKRLIKSPKLYFTDTGLLCYLLGIRSPDDLAIHALRGNIFECYVVSELTKAYLHQGLEPPLYFWRDSTGHEIDLIIEDGEKLHPIEIKSGRTLAGDMLQALFWWNRLSGQSSGSLVYGGDEAFTRQGVEICPWFEL